MKLPSLSTDFRLPILRGLAAASLHPALRRVLFLDATPQDVDEAAATMAELLGAVTGEPAVRITLAPHHDDDDLWGFGAGLPAGWERPGLLVSTPSDPSWRLVVVPDLPSLSLPAARACLQLLETDLGRLERQGQSRTWRPRLAWLAACPTAAVGQVSPHLLDRFPVRFHAIHWRDHNRTAELRSWLTDAPAPRNSSAAEESARVIEVLRDRSSSPLPFASLAIEAVLDLLEPWKKAPGVRRPLGLARLAQALAQIDGIEEAGQAQVQEAAALMGILAPQAPEQAPPEIPPASPPPSLPARDKKSPSVSQQPERTTPTSEEPREVSPAWEGGSEAKSLLSDDEITVAYAEFGEIQLSLSPFPEDGAPVERPHAPFQLPVASHSRARRDGGPAAGVRSTSDPDEIALVPTILAAMPYQPLRRRALGRSESDLVLALSDWKARRRAARPEELLVLVLDATAYGQSDWPVSLVPFIREAYLRRSAVCVVLVGALGAPHELRAERILAHNVVAPAVAAALDRGPGRATPLASGFHFALEAIRDARHRGRGAVVRATLVILSDGRGNVPLEASRTGWIGASVAAEGIEDALLKAAQLGTLDRVEKVLLNPQPPHAAHLVERLAEALHARIIPVPHREAAEVEEKFQ